MRDKFTHYNNMTIVKKLLRESANNLKGNAYVGEYNEIRYIGVTNCDLLHVKENFAARHLSVATPKGSPLIHKINEAIQELWDVRAFDDWSWKWWKENVNEEICIIIDDRFGGISIQNFAGVFSIPIFGIMIASIGLVVEYYYYRDKPRPGMFGDEDDVSDASGSASGSGKGSSIKKVELSPSPGGLKPPVSAKRDQSPGMSPRPPRNLRDRFPSVTPNQ